MKYLAEKALGWQKIVPQTYPCTHIKPDGSARPLFYDGIDGTRVFAWVGLPDGASASRPVPGMVLIHGGGGTAFSRWVRYWNARGYAAIAMDTCGAMPEADGARGMAHPRHAWGGAPGWGAFGDQMELPPEKQWFTHAVSAVIFGHDLLRAMPEVDAERIGVTGVSWGGVLTILAAGVDPRFRAACPVYACGFLYEENPWIEKETRHATASAIDWWRRHASASAVAWWQNEWDPANFVPAIGCPILWYASTNDETIFYPKSWQRTTELANQSERSLVVRLHHAHGRFSEEQHEIDAFFDEYLADGRERVKLTDTRLEDGRLTVRWRGERPRAALLAFTLEKNYGWFFKEWLELPAEVGDGVLSAELPDGWQAAFLTAVTPDFLRITSGMVFSPDSAD